MIDPKGFKERQWEYDREEPEDREVSFGGFFEGCDEAFEKETDR